MSESILDSTKKVLGLDPEYKEFDVDLLTHINTAFSILHQIGIGPKLGFLVTSDGETWEDFLGGDLRINSVKSYVYLRVRLLFDPPTTSFHQEALKAQYQELEWRLSIVREGDEWVRPAPSTNL